MELHPIWFKCVLSYIAFSSNESNRISSDKRHKTRHDVTGRTSRKEIDIDAQN